MLEQRGLGLLVVGILAAAACAGGTTIEEGGTAATTGTQTTSGMGGAITTSSASGGSGGTMTSSSGMALPCGIDCSTIQTDDCHEAICNTTSKQCEISNVSNGTSCEDGLFCTVDDSCVDGVCMGGGANDCGMTPADCDDVVCDESSKGCSTTPKANGAPCTNATDLCLVNTSCQAGLCLGTTKDCFFQPVPNECYSSICNPSNGMCEPKADPMKDGTPCVDGTDPCTVNKTCSNGMCAGGSPKDCSGLTIGCNIGVCDMMTGMCVGQAVMQGQMCDDLDGCTLGETCNNGVCGGGTAVTQCSGQTADGCCPSGCTDQNDTDCGGFNPTLFPIALNPSSYGLGDIDIDANGNLLAVTGTPRNVWSVNRLTGAPTIVAQNVCSGTQLVGVVHRSSDNLIYVATNLGNICSVTYSGTVTSLVSLNEVVNALAIAPQGFGPYGGQVIAVMQSGRIAAFNPTGNAVTNITMSAGAVSDVAFGPTGIMYVSGGATVRTVSATGMVTQFVAGLSAADGIAVDPDNSRLFVADSGTDTIRQVTIPGKVVSTLYNANIDNGYFVAGIIHDKQSTLIYATGESNYTLVAQTP